MIKPPEKLVKIIAWICMIGSLPVILMGLVMLTAIFGQDRYAASITTVVGPFLVILSLLLFSIGAVILDFKGVRIYKMILTIGIVCMILFFLAGEFQII